MRAVEPWSVSVARAAWSFLLSQKYGEVEVSVGREFEGVLNWIRSSSLYKNKCQFYRNFPGLGLMR